MKTHKDEIVSVPEEVPVIAPEPKETVAVTELPEVPIQTEVVDGPMYGPELPPDFLVSEAASEPKPDPEPEPEPAPASELAPEPEDLGDKIFNLPDRDTMLERLLAVSDNSHLQERLYPLLLKDAGHEKVAIGIIMMVVLAISEYCNGLPPSILVIMHHDVDSYIRALIVDEQIAQYAVGQWNEMSAIRHG